MGRDVLFMKFILLFQVCIVRPLVIFVHVLTAEME